MATALESGETCRGSRFSFSGLATRPRWPLLSLRRRTVTVPAGHEGGKNTPGHVLWVIAVECSGPGQPPSLPSSSLKEESRLTNLILVLNMSPGTSLPTPWSLQKVAWGDLGLCSSLSRFSHFATLFQDWIPACTVAHTFPVTAGPASPSMANLGYLRAGPP